MNGPVRTSLLIAALPMLALAAPVADATDAAWQAPFTLQLPETVRTIVLRPRTDPVEFAADHGLTGARIVPMGRGASALEMPMEDTAWEAVQSGACTDRDVAGCESATCQGIQLRGSAAPGSDQSAEAIQARLVRNAPETVLVPDPANPEAGSCRGAPVVLPLDETSALATGQNVTIDLSLLDSPGGVTDKTADVTANPELATADPAAAPAEPGAAAEPARRSFEFSVSSLFNPAGGVDLGTDQLPADTSDWTLVVGAGCSEVKVPLNAIEPARLPGIVVALVATADVANVASAYGLTVLNEHPLASTGENIVTYATTQNIFTVIAAMALDGRINDAQPEYVFETTAEAGFASEAVAQPRAYSDPFAVMNYAPGKTGALQLHGEASGNGQLIAVIDTGIDVSHPDLSNRLREPVDTTGNGYAAENHGTAVAGIIAAEADNAIGSYGVAPAAELLPIKACQPKEEGGLAARCTTSTLVKALDVAISEDAAIINMSLAGPPDDLVSRYVNLALDQGRLVVAGAGNGGIHGKPGYPAAIPGVLAVTAVDAIDRLYTKANRGEYIDIAAPGVDIVATVPDGQYPPLSGTSMAAAHVTGIAALIRELGPLMSSREVAMVIKTSTRDLGEPGHDSAFGAGLVDACKAAAAATADAVSCDQGGAHADLNAF
jgi:subtilisin family serine protease